MNFLELQKEYRSYLILKNYRPQTIKSYTFIISHFLQFCRIHSSAQKTVLEYAKFYLLERFNEGKSWSSVNTDYSAILILCRYILHEDWSYKMIPRPRAEKKLPQALSGKQIENMINGIKNMKHKTIVVILYSTGIRSSELINLDIADICMDRSQLHVHLGKGGKDRIVQLPLVTIEFIKTYLRQYKPKRYLFEGQGKSVRYSSSSIRKIVQRAADREAIENKVSTHTLRHSYATHHIMNGTDIITLQKQMGHTSIKTTIKYIHICAKRLQQLKHPIASLKINTSLIKASDIS